MFSRLLGLRRHGGLLVGAAVAAGLMVVPPARADILGFKNGDPNVWTSTNAVGGDQPGFNGDSLTITTDAANEHNSAFYNNPQFVTGFLVTFTYQAGGALAAHGATFCCQNDLRGPQAVGDQDGGGALGYQGIQYSAAIAINLSSGSLGHTDFCSMTSLATRKTREAITWIRARLTRRSAIRSGLP